MNLLFCEKSLMCVYDGPKDSKSVDFDEPGEEPKIVTNCYMDVDVLLAHSASVARGNFKDAARRWVLIHVPTTPFFALHNIDANAHNL